MTSLQQHADNIRRRIIEESYKNQTAHVGSCLSCVEILTVLFFEVMKPGDKFILSPGHKALALYAALVEKGIIDHIDLKELGGHPKRNPAIGIEVSTGSLGHGLSLGCGFALAGNQTYVLLSDGDLNEGSNSEALKFMYSHDIPLIAMVDRNRFSAYQETDPYPGCNGHNLKEIKDTLSERGSDYLSFNTIKGKGLPRFENKLESHYWKVTKEDYEEYLRSNPA